MLPAVLVLLLTAALRLWLLQRQRAALLPQDQAYATGLVGQRVGAQLWQQAAPLLLVAAAPWRPADAAVLLFGAVLAGWLWELPAKAWKPFVLDARHGLNRLGAAAFAREQGLKFALFVLLAAPAAVLAPWLLARFGEAGWLAIWGLGYGGWLLIRIVQPRLIAPLFDPVEPLPDGALRGRLARLLDRCGVAEHRLYRLRSSARSTQANAQVSGHARRPRIVLGDTLIDLLQPDEIEAVVAHELGHIQRGHLRMQVLMIGAGSLLMVLAAAALTAGIAESGLRLALAWLLLPSLWLAALPVVNGRYRAFEFEADASAAANASGAALARALRRLTANNRNAPLADVWYERVYHTHPATHERLDRLDRAGT